MRRLIVYGVYCAFNWNKYTICQNFQNTFAFHHQWLGNEKREKILEKNPVLQLQKNGDLSPEEISLLSLGPKFSVTPQEVPRMDIICETEKNAQKLERRGEKDKAQTLRHVVAETLRKAKKPKSNLNFHQRKALSSLRKNKDLAITPFDKGMGFAVNKKDKLVEKAEKEFQNVTMDTPDTTDSLKRKIQNKLRQLKKKVK